LFAGLAAGFFTFELLHRGAFSFGGKAAHNQNVHQRKVESKKAKVEGFNELKPIHPITAK
jgi:hypothetical protein